MPTFQNDEINEASLMERLGRGCIDYMVYSLGDKLRFEGVFHLNPDRKVQKSKGFVFERKFSKKLDGVFTK